MNECWIVSHIPSTGRFSSLMLMNHSDRPISKTACKLQKQTSVPFLLPYSAISHSLFNSALPKRLCRSQHPKSLGSSQTFPPPPPPILIFQRSRLPAPSTSPSGIPSSRWHVKAGHPLAYKPPVTFPLSSPRYLHVPPLFKCHLSRDLLWYPMGELFTPYLTLVSFIKF